MSIVFGTTPSFQSCIENRKSAKEYQELYVKNHGGGVILVRIELNGACVGHVFYAEHDAIEALAALVGGLFSLILTVSTVFLWAETRRLALGADAQSKDMRDSIAEAARAADAMERAEKAASAQAASMQQQTNILSQTLLATQTSATILNQAYLYMIVIEENCAGYSAGVDKSLTFKFKLKNYGRTPCEISGIDFMIKVEPIFTAPIYPKRVMFGLFPINQDESTQEFSESFSRPEKDLLGETPLDEQTIYFCGRVMYSDIFGRLRFISWCFAYDKALGILIRHGGLAYNQKI